MQTIQSAGFGAMLFVGIISAHLNTRQQENIGRIIWKETIISRKTQQTQEMSTREEHPVIFKIGVKIRIVPSNIF